MKKLVMGLFGVILLAGSVAVSAAEIAGNVTLASDYRFRGISQLDGNVSPAIQGGFDSSFDNGIYVGTWASNVNLGTKASIEHDFYAGWANDSFDVGFIYYSYPRDDGQELDYLEIQGSFSFLDYYKVGVNYSDDYYAETGTFVYLYGDISYPINDQFSVDAHLGYNALDDEAVRVINPASPLFGECVGSGFLCEEDAYLDWSLGVSYSGFMGVDISLTYIGIDIDEEELFDTDNIGDDTIVLAISKSL